jgi:hypothetical protein
MSLTPPPSASPQSAVVETVQAGTARLRLAARINSSTPEDADCRGHGLVDFTHDRVWLTDRVITERMATDKRRQMGFVSRVLFRGLQALIEGAAASNRELYFQGGALFTSTKDGVWDQPTGTIDGPKYTRHPLCILEPLSLVTSPSEYLSLEFIDNTPTTKYRIALTADQFHPPVWRDIVDPEVTSQGQGTLYDSEPRDEVEAVVWVDSEERIRRMTYESSRDGAGGSVLWSTTEFYDFGIPIERSIPIQVDLSAIEGRRHE